MHEPEDRHRASPGARHASEPLAARGLWALALLVAASTFAWALARPLDWLLGVVPDDAFYYLTIARNLARTGASSFDGVHPTNGYHPGWMAIATLVAAFAREPLFQLRALLVAAFAFHVGASLLIVVAARRFTSEARAWVAGSLWLVSLLPFRLALQGMEGSFYVFALALAWTVYMGRLYQRERPTNGDLLVFGLALSLCFWGRTEAMLLAILVIPTVSGSLHRSGWLRPLLVLSLAFAAGVAPWFAWSRLATGALFQQSGAMKLMWAAESAPAVGPRLWHGLQYLLGTWVSLPVVGGLDGAAHGWRGAVNALVLLILLALLAVGLRRDATRPLARVGLVLIGVTLLTGCYYAFLSSDRQFWYKAQPGFLLFVVLFFTAAEALAHRPALAARGVVAVVVGVLVAALLLQVGSLATYPWQKDVFHSQRRFEAIVPEGEWIGCFNAGIPGFFARRPVVNLDGLVNNSIALHYRSRSVDRYLVDEHIHWVADEERAWGRAVRFMGQPPDREVVATSLLTGEGSELRYLWRVTPVSATVAR